MNSRSCFLILVVVIFIFRNCYAVVAQQKKLPNIVTLAASGTIAGAAATGTQAGYMSGMATIDAMLAAVWASRISPM